MADMDGDTDINGVRRRVAQLEMSIRNLNATIKAMQVTLDRLEDQHNDIMARLRALETPGIERGKVLSIVRDGQIIQR